jgi:hypothetical protein
MGFIYGLCDPHTNELRYIGQTSQELRHRLRKHVIRAHDGQTYCAKWIRSLERIPKIIQLHECANSALDQWEWQFIAAYRLMGARLTNITEGGAGSRGWHHTDEAKNKIAIAQRGRRWSAERRAAFSVYRRATPPTPAQRAASKVSIRKNGRQYATR